MFRSITARFSNQRLKRVYVSTKFPVPEKFVSPSLLRSRIKGVRETPIDRLTGLKQDSRFEGSKVNASRRRSLKIVGTIIFSRSCGTRIIRRVKNAGRASCL